MTTLPTNKYVILFEDPLPVKIIMNNIKFIVQAETALLFL